jgi:HK97 family phage major capsid protein
MTSETLNLARVAQPGISTTGSPVTNAATGAWKLENDLIDESDLTLERVTLTARTLPLLLKMSVELFEDAPNISTIVEQEMATSTALELDRVALVGSGTPPEPRGLLNQSGVNTDTLGSPADWDFLIDAAGTLWDEDHEPNAAIYGVSLAVLLAKLRGGDDQPLQLPPELANVRRFRSKAAGAHAFIGDFTQLLIGMRTSFRIEVSRTGGAETFERLQVAVRSYIRADIAVAHPEAFVVLS